MQKISTIRTLALILLLICLLAGVIHLFILRFQTGDIYPAYSSLRSDPLGTRAFYESLENIDDITVRRNYHLLSSLKFEPQTTFLYLGARVADNELMPESIDNVFKRLTRSGGHLVLSFLPIIRENEEKPCLSNKDDGEDKIDLKSEHDDAPQKPTSEKEPEASGESDPDA